MKRTLLFLLITLSILSGCGGSSIPTSNTNPSQGSLTLNIHESGVSARTIQPDLDMNIASYDITGSGPNGTSFHQENVPAGAPVAINALAEGNWTITVDAKNAAGTIIASGVANVTVVAGVATGVDITVKPLTGTGALQVSVSWPSGIIANPTVTGTLTPVGGSPVNISFTLSPDDLSATYQNSALQAGYYTLLVQLKDGSTVKWGAIESVRIIAGQTSTGAYPLTADPGSIGDIQLVINPDLQNPITITFSGQQETIPVGSAMTVTATTSEPVDSYQWYLNGTLLVGQTGTSITIGSSLAQGIYRLDLAVVKGSIVSTGYLTFMVGTPSPTPTSTLIPTPSLSPTPFHGPAILAATQNGLSISTNGGSSFTTYTTANGLGSNIIWSVFVSGSTIYVGTGGGGLSISTNGGASFTTYTTVNGLGDNRVSCIYVSGSTIYAGTWGGGLSISTNGGASFTTYTTANGLGHDNVEDIYVSGSTIYVSTNGGLSKSTNGGISFTNYTTANGLGYDGVRGIFVSGSMVYAATVDGLSISSNGGVSFTNYSTANGLMSHVINDVYVSGSSIYAATSSGGLSKSTDGGVSFITYSTADGLGSNWVEGVYVSGSTIYAATQGGLSISTNGGASFTNYTTANGLGDNFIGDILVL